MDSHGNKIERASVTQRLVNHFGRDDELFAQQAHQIGDMMRLDVNFDIHIVGAGAGRRRRTKRRYRPIGK